MVVKPHYQVALYRIAEDKESRQLGTDKSFKIASSFPKA